MKNKDAAACGKKKTKKATLAIALIFVLAAAITLAILIHIRVNPKWKAAKLTIEPSGLTHDFKEIDPDGTTLETRIAPPEGYERVPVEEGSFGEYIRNYKLLPDGVNLPVYDGTTLSPEDAAAIFDISLGDEGYQQCADSIIRLYADYFYENKTYDKISFHFTNGDVCDYERWRKGRRMLVLHDLSVEIPAAFYDDSEQQYRNYLKEVMNYAGTLSLRDESEVIPVGELRIGDIVCSDSHVVMIADEAVNDKGEKCYLIGQSFIPAVCFHIVVNRNGDNEAVWFTEEQLERRTFRVGGYKFDKTNIRRWKDGF